MRDINLIVVHCSATKTNQEVDMAVIDKWHRQRGWRKIGYHFVINRDGVVEEGRAKGEVGAHVKGKNKNSLGICLIGGIDEKGNAESNYTKEQWKALEQLVDYLLDEFGDIEVSGHNEYAAKACPCFNVKEWQSNRKQTS
jgi:N-acetylmuramoyl-L-alanine amidase